MFLFNFVLLKRTAFLQCIGHIFSGRVSCRDFLCDSPLDLVWSVASLQLPNVSGKFGLVLVFDVVDGFCVVPESYLEFVGCDPDVCFRFVIVGCCYNFSLVYHIGLKPSPGSNLSTTSKGNCLFNSFDIVDFYPSISEQLLDRAKSWAKQFTNITDRDVTIIKHTRKSLLFHQNRAWSKRNSDNTFDVTMGSYDGAEVCELIGLFIMGGRYLQKYNTCKMNRHKVK